MTIIATAFYPPGQHDAMSSNHSKCQELPSMEVEGKGHFRRPYLCCMVLSAILRDAAAPYLPSTTPSASPTAIR